MLQTPRNENWHAHYSLRARSMAINASMSQGQLTRDFGTGAPYLLVLFARAVRYTHKYLASTLTHCGVCNLFFDVQEVTLLLGKHTLFARANLCYPTTRLYSYFSTIFAACFHVCTMGCKRNLSLVFYKCFQE